MGDYYYASTNSMQLMRLMVALMTQLVRSGYCERTLT